MLLRRSGVWHLLATPSTQADTVGGHRVMCRLRCCCAGSSAADSQYGGRPHGRPQGDVSAEVVLYWWLDAKAEERSSPQHSH